MAPRRSAINKSPRPARPSTPTKTDQTSGVGRSPDEGFVERMVTPFVKTANLPAGVTLPTTTKGDIIVHNGSANVRQGIGADGYVLTADSAQANGLKWAAASGGAGVTDGDKGDVVVSSSGAVWTVDTNVIDNTKLAQMAQATLKGRASGAGTGNPQDLTPAQAKTLLAIAVADVTGLATIASTGSASDLSSGTVPAARMPALTGDVTSSAGAVATTIANNAVTNAKAAQMAANTIKGNNTGATANAADLTATQVKSLLAIAASDVSGLAAIATSGSAADLSAGTVPAARMPAHTGDVTSSAGSVALTIAANAVVDADIRQSAGLSVIGRSANTTGNVADITAGTDQQVLRRSGSTLGFGVLALGAFGANIITYAKLQQVSATSRIIGRKTAGAGDMEECTLSDILDFVGSAAQGDILYRGASSWTRLPAGTSGQYLQTQGAGANPQWAGSSTGYQTLHPNAADYLSSTFPQIVKNGTNIPVKGLAYDAAADEAAFWRIYLEDYASGNLTVKIRWYADTASSGDVVWGAAFAAITPDTDTQDTETKALATEQTVTDTHLGTVGQRLHTCSITLSNLDSLTQGDSTWMRIRRLGSSGSDTMTGDAILESVVVSYTKA